MDGPRDELLPRTAFALDQHRTGDRRHLPHGDDHLAHRLALAPEPCLLCDTLAVEEFDHRLPQRLGADRLGQNLGEPKRAEAVLERGVADIGEADHRGTAPELLPDERERLRIEQTAGEDDDIGMRALDLATEVVERGDDVRLDAVGLKECVETNGGFDVGEGDQDAHKGR